MQSMQWLDWGGGTYKAKVSHYVHPGKLFISKGLSWVGFQLTHTL